MGLDPATPRVSGHAVLHARIELTLFLLGLIACLCAASGMKEEASAKKGPGDIQLYRRVVERVRAGESYYDAAHGELISRGFPSRSVFNWRTPCYAWFLGRGPGPVWGRWILLAGMTGVVVSWCLSSPDDFGLSSAAVGGVFLVGATAWSIEKDAVYLMEIWAAMLIALSVCAYRRGLTVVGIGSGLLAVFYRELALPYAVVCLGIAFQKGRKYEVAVWAVGLMLFAAFMECHAVRVRERISDDDVAMTAGWLRFGGRRFLLATARTNVFLMPLPPWCTAIYLALATVGLTGGRGESGWRVGLTAALFLGSFSIVGNPFNFYWGFLNAPLLAIGVAGSPRALSGLISSALRLPRSQPCVDP